MEINIQKEAVIDRTPRVEMLESMFEVPTTTKLSVSLSGTIDLDSPWNIGLIVGPSGSGKTLLLESLFGQPQKLDWYHKSVIDDFRPDLSMEVISRVCQSVGFNTIPSWLRPYSVLSNGERFRVEVARRLLGSLSPITIDEFTSVVDRQVAQIASHAVQKYVRESNKQLVAASCHYDIIDWLQPDWILEPGKNCKLTWRSLRRRPPITVSVSRVKYETWELFKDFHYMSQDLNRAARCYGIFVKDTTRLDSRLVERDVYTLPHRGCGNSGDDFGLRISPGHMLPHFAEHSDLVSCPNDEIASPSNDATRRIASMCGVLHRPHPKVRDIVGFTRMVTLPDWQGIGLAFVLATTVASAYKSLGKRLHSYPNHPAWIRSYQRSSDWLQVKQSGEYSPRRGKTSTVGGFGDRRCAVFMFVGNPMNKDEAVKLIGGYDIND